MMNNTALYVLFIDLVNYKYGPTKWEGLTSELMDSLYWLTFSQLLLIVISFILPKPDLNWIGITRWNPEIYKFTVYVSQLILPLA